MTFCPEPGDLFPCVPVQITGLPLVEYRKIGKSPVRFITSEKEIITNIDSLVVNEYNYNGHDTASNKLTYS